MALPRPTGLPSTPTICILRAIFPGVCPRQTQNPTVYRTRRLNPPPICIRIILWNSESLPSRSRRSCRSDVEIGESRESDPWSMTTDSAGGVGKTAKAASAHRKKITNWIPTSMKNAADLRAEIAYSIESASILSISGVSHRWAQQLSILQSHGKVDSRIHRLHLLNA